MTSDATPVFCSVNHLGVAHITNFLYMCLKIVTLNWNGGIHDKMKSRGLIHSGFHLSMMISIKLSKQSVLWRGMGEGKGGRREKYLLHNKVLFLKSPKTSRKLFHFDLKSEFITCAYVILLCTLFLESTPVSFTKCVARRQMTKFNDSMTKPDESLAIVNDYSRKPNENWFFSVSAKAVKFLLEENRCTRVLAICPRAGAVPRPNVGLMSK